MARHNQSRIEKRLLELGGEQRIVVLELFRAVDQVVQRCVDEQTHIDRTAAELLADVDITWEDEYHE